MKRPSAAAASSSHNAANSIRTVSPSTGQTIHSAAASSTMPKNTFTPSIHPPARGSSVRTEAVAGVTTFLAMVYSVFVVPGMLGNAGFDTSAVFVARMMLGDSLRAAFEHTLAAVNAVVKATWDAGRYELELVAAQDQIARPREWFDAWAPDAA